VSSDEPLFLEVEDVIELHATQLEIYGGSLGLQDRGVLSAVVFLDVNGISIDQPSEALYELTMGVAEGRIDKPAVAAELERIAKSKG